MKSISYLNQQLAEAEKCRDAAKEAMTHVSGNPRKYVQERESFNFWRGEYFKIKGELERRLPNAN